MKKIILFLLTGFALFFGNAFASVCSEFDAGKLCLWLKNVWNGQYSIKVKFKPVEKKYNYKLNCQVLTPDNYIKEMGTCNWTFEYFGKWVWKIEYYISLEWQKKIIKDSYDFTNNPEPYFEDDEDDNDNDDNDYWFTSKQLKDIKYVYNIWPNFINKLEKKYPSLKKSDDWQDFEEYIYEQMQRFFEDDSSEIKNYAIFKEIIIDFIKLTKQER